MAKLFKELGSKKVLPGELRGMAFSLTNLADGMKDSIDVNGDKILKNLEKLDIPELKDARSRKTVMEKTRKELLAAIEDKDYQKLSDLLDCDLVEGLIDKKTLGRLTSPGDVAAWPAAAAAVVVAATLAHSVYTSVTNADISARFSNPNPVLFNRAGRFRWF